MTSGLLSMARTSELSASRKARLPLASTTSSQKCRSASAVVVEVVCRRCRHDADPRRVGRPGRCDAGRLDADAAAHLEAVAQDHRVEPLAGAREVREQVEAGGAADVEDRGAAAVDDPDEAGGLRGAGGPRGPRPG